MTKRAQRYLGDHLPDLVAQAGLSWAGLAAKVGAHLQNGPVTAQYLEAVGTGLLPVAPALADALCQALGCKAEDLQLVGDPKLGVRRRAFQTYVRSAGLDLGEQASLALSSVRVGRRASTLVSPAEWQALHGQQAQRTLDELFRQPAQPLPPPISASPYACTIPCPRCGALNHVDRDRCYACGRHLHQPDD